ncbi:hypothetical protein [Bradyrhizobium pachyrhizi]|uniref:hypothetical protein n=1 Tax=Bradyrhizobium pachyrhizi TaxID=280333 RepID=UPI001FD2CFEE|nr:hypothetical protein [Bradyrhizobium pachyrhizi]
MSLILKIVAVAAIFLGEAISIIAELIASRRFGKAGGDVTMLLPMFLLISFGGILLVFGYALGYMHLKNIGSLSQYRWELSGGGADTLSSPL